MIMQVFGLLKIFIIFQLGQTFRHFISCYKLQATMLAGGAFYASRRTAKKLGTLKLIILDIPYDS